MLQSALTPLHYVYLIGVICILFVMILRKDTPIICIGFLFLLGIVGTNSVIGGIQTIFKAILYAGKEFMEIIATIDEENFSFGTLCSGSSVMPANYADRWL